MQANGAGAHSLHSFEIDIQASFRLPGSKMPSQVSGDSFIDIFPSTRSGEGIGPHSVIGDWLRYWVIVDL